MNAKKSSIIGKKNIHAGMPGSSSTLVSVQVGIFSMLCYKLYTVQRDLVRWAVSLSQPARFTKSTEYTIHRSLYILAENCLY